MIKLKNILFEGIEPYPKSPLKSLDNNPNSVFRYAAGNEANNIPSFFVAAAADLDALKNILSKNGWTEHNDTTDDEYGNQTWSEWLQSSGYKRIELDLSDYQKEQWQKNVVPNAKSLSMLSTEQFSVYASTWDAFNDWTYDGKSAIPVRLCKYGKFKSCASELLYYSQTKFPNWDSLNKEITRILSSTN